MITALTGAAEKIPAPTRPSHEETLTRREAPKPASFAFDANESESAVVEISREGARRAQAKEQEQKIASPAQQAALSASSKSGAASASASSAAVPVSAGAQVSAELTAADSASSATSPTTQVDQGDANQFDEADANQDGTVNVLEKRAFDFMHPTLERYPGANEDPSQRTIAAELKAYEAVARSGRTL